MPAKKPADLVVRADTKANRGRRAEGEAAITPKQPLDQRPPAQLTGRIARAIWEQTVSMYFTLDARIVSLLDQGLLMDYCIACEQLAQIDELRATSMTNYTQMQTSLDKVLISKKEIDPKLLTRMVNAVNRSLDEIIKLDARADRKRALLHTFRQSLMLTPRSRGGVNPDEKKAEAPKSELDKLIDR